MNAHIPYSSDHLAAVGRALYGERWQTPLANDLNVNERTLRRWLAEDDAFTAEYDAARKATCQAGIARVQALTARGVETLEELLDARVVQGGWSSRSRRRRVGQLSAHIQGR